MVLGVLHRLMMLEAVQKGRVSPGNDAWRLRERPDVVRALDEYARQAGRIDEMGVRILPLDSQVTRASHEVRRGAGLLINDSISIAMIRQYTWPVISDTADSSESETSVELQ